MMRSIWIVMLILGGLVAPAGARSPGRVPGAALLAGHELRGLTVAAGPAGGLWAAWEQDDGSDVELYFSRESGGRWAAARPVHLRPDAWDRFPSLAVDAGGTPWLAWSSSTRAAPERKRIYTSRWTGSRWTEPAAVPAGGMERATAPALAAAPDGTLWLGWVGFDGTDDEIVASRWDGQVWSEPIRVNANDADWALYDHDPQMAIAGDGRPWLAWTGHRAGLDDAVYASRWTGAGWTPEQQVSADDDAPDNHPALIVDAGGQPWIAWDGWIDDGGGGHWRVLTSHWDASRGAWTPEAIASSPAGAGVDEQYPVLGRDGGRLRLAWIVSNSTWKAVAGAAAAGDEWGVPQLARAGASAARLASPGVGDGEPAVFWLDPALDSSLPLDSAAPDAAAPLADWLQANPAPKAAQLLVTANRYLAFGDSITWGSYGEPPFYPYPSILNDTLNNRVRPSEVINSGVPGEATPTGRRRIGDVAGQYTPQFVLIMEGTNDVSQGEDPAIVQKNLAIMIDILKGVGVRRRDTLFATLIPRKDNLNDETQEMNELAVRGAALDKGVAVCDQWQAFYNYGDWQSIYWDEKHPGQVGLQLIADTFYGCILLNFDGIDEDVTPPTAALNPVPSPIECSGGVPVSWTGADNANGTGVANFDVQVQVDGGAWADWLAATPATGALYTGVSFGHVYGFHVRARDRMGNVSAYTAPGSATVVDSTPPPAPQMPALRPASKAPFAVSWLGTDACSLVVGYDVQFRAGTAGAWQPWLANTPATGGLFDPAAPQYGETYYFQARSRDQAGNWGAWSSPVSTRLARYTVGGGFFTVRHAPVAGVTLAVAPLPLLVEPRPGGFVAYLDGAGAYSLTAGRNGFGSLPAMQDVAVNGDLAGLQFVLPPFDDTVANGGLETGSLAGWQAAGSSAPVVQPGGHTGSFAVRLDGAAGRSVLAQQVMPVPGAVDPTLSFMARLEQPGPAASLDVAFDGPATEPFTVTVPIDDGQWTHVWLDLAGVMDSPLTVRFAVAGQPAVRLDEIALGSARRGAYAGYMPVIVRGR